MPERGTPRPVGLDRVFEGAYPVDYEIWSNGSDRVSRFFTGYRPGDAMFRSWQGSLDRDGWSAEELLNGLFEQFSADNRPNRATADRLSVGDVVVLGGEAWSVMPHGWEPVKVFRPFL